MGYQVDFLQVGNGETSGDCIALRFGDLHSADPQRQHVIVIDGGFIESGEKLVEHIKSYYGTNYVDVVVSTHTDRDHIAGLKPVIELLNVGQLVMHRPWIHSVSSGANEAQEARKSYDQASELEQLATAKNIPIVEPFAGEGITFTDSAYMYVLGPDQTYYEELLKDFDHNKSALAKAIQALHGPAITATNILRKIQETLDPSSSTLDNVPKNMSAENNSSAIIYFNIEGHGMLFTGDAGVEALNKAIDFAVASQLDLTKLNFLDVPHHGSKHNLDTATLNRIQARTAFISAAKESKKHPSPRVINELVRRGYGVFTTEANNILHHLDSPQRAGWSSLTSYSLIPEFDEDDE